MARYYLGIDIGGTKSHALLVAENGAVLGVGRGGPGNHEVVGYDGFQAVLHQIVHQTLQQADLPPQAISAAGYGIAGFDWPAEAPGMQAVIDSLGLNIPTAFVNDALIGLVAGAPTGWGVAVIAGTGNNCWGRNAAGQHGRITGRGPLMGEYGGASEIVRRAIQAIAWAWTQRGPATCLTNTFMTAVNAPSVDALLSGISLDSYQFGAAQAPLVFDCAAQGDAVAEAIIKWAGVELGESVLAVSRQLAITPQAFDVVMIGSLLKVSSALRHSLQQRVQQDAPAANFIPLTAPPVVGGVLLAMEQHHQPTPHIRQRLLAEAGTHLN